MVCDVVFRGNRCLTTRNNAATMRLNNGIAEPSVGNSSRRCALIYRQLLILVMMKGVWRVCEVIVVSWVKGFKGDGVWHLGKVSQR